MTEMAIQCWCIARIAISVAKQNVVPARFPAATPDGRGGRSWPAQLAHAHLVAAIGEHLERLAVLEQRLRGIPGGQRVEVSARGKLIREHKLDILDLPMAEVTKQYMDHLLLMEELNLEVAAEFVAMAAQLLQIKSRMMLPRPPAEEGGEDPREDLVQKLLDYQHVKEAARQLTERESAWYDASSLM